MRDEKITRVMHALGEGKALLVGGCVRDWLMARLVRDIDIATILTPAEMQKNLMLAGIKWIPTGLDHGTITAVIEGKTFEITTLRRDVSTDGRRATVAFTDDWAEDAARRDFTINALYADLKGNVFDPAGQGMADIQAQRLRFVGDPAQRIAEDYLRILRYFRFAAQFGWMLDDEAALAACRAAAPQLERLSGERITQEVLKLLAADEPVRVLSLMQENEILPDFLKNFDEGIFGALCRIQNSTPPLPVSLHAQPPSPQRGERRGEGAYVMTRLSLFPDAENKLVLSNEQKRQVVQLRNGAARFSQETPASIKRLIYEDGNAPAREIYLLWCAHNKKEPQAALLDLFSNWQAPVFPIKGEDLIAEGYKPGPDLGAELKRREAAWLEIILKK